MVRGRDNAPSKIIAKSSWLQKQTQAVSPGNEKPPVIILNMFYSGLAIARDMAGTGAKVIGLSADRATYGNFTRSCEVRFAPDSQSEPDQLAEYLCDAAAELRGSVIFPTRDADVVFLDRFREKLKEYRLAIPTSEVLGHVIDKSELAKAAVAAGVAVPRTMVASQTDDLNRVAAAVGFPCVVKPVKAYEWRGIGKWETVGRRKAFRADDEQDLRYQYLQVAQVTPQVLIQQWIPGATSEIAIFGGYFGPQAQALGYFCARKLVQEPEDFGTGCIVENTELRELVEPSARLCKSLNYRGLAEIEYKRDAATGEYKLIEINTRHWDQHRLAHMSGVNLTRIAYSDICGHALDATTSRYSGGKWVAEDALFYYLAQGLYHGKLKWKTLRSQWSGRKMFGIFSWRDPMPFLRYSFSSMVPRMGRMAWSKIRQKGLG
jgi:predicted ATP-grasp superfamily ATP-dependent carboligase